MHARNLSSGRATSLLGVRSFDHGFTLIELLVVVSVIAILAGMLLPVLVKTKQQGQKAMCLSNLHQIGLGLKMYLNDHSDTFPPAVSSQAGLLRPGEPDYYLGGNLGGTDPLPAFASFLPPASNRPLAQYVPARETFRCPADRGFEHDGLVLRPTLYDSGGCTYRLNHSVQAYYQNAGLAQDPDYNLALKKESWVREPSRFIAMHEPAAYPFDDGNGGIWITQWHAALSPGKMYNATTIKGSGDKLVAPALCVDGHSQQFDFTTNMKKNPLRGIDPGKDWIWYKPR